MDGGYPLELIARNEVATNCMILAGCTVLIYDHALTLSHEVKFIWPLKFGVVSAIFLFNRYAVPAMIVVDVAGAFSLFSPSSVGICRIWNSLQAYLTIITFLSFHIIVAMRVHALHGGRRFIKIALWVGGVLYALASTTIVTIVETVWIQGSCERSLPTYVWASWIPSVVFESFIFGLTIYAAINQRREDSDFASLYMTLYRDGSFFFIAVSLCSLFSLLVWATAGPTLVGLARYFALAMVNVAGTRLILNLKVHASSSRSTIMNDFDRQLKRRTHSGQRDVIIVTRPSTGQSVASGASTSPLPSHPQMCSHGDFLSLPPERHSRGASIAEEGEEQSWEAI